MYKKEIRKEKRDKFDKLSSFYIFQQKQLRNEV